MKIIAIGARRYPTGFRRPHTDRDGRVSGDTSALVARKVALVRGALGAFNSGALDLLLSRLAPDVEADWSEAIGPFRGVYRGHEGVRSLWEGFFDAWTGLRWDVEELRDLDDGRVVSVTNMTGQGKESGVEVAARAAWLWTIDGGAVKRVRFFQTIDDALRAA